MTRSIVLVSLLFLAGATGCDRTHMSCRFGRTVRSALARQVINPAAGTGSSATTEGLDPQEAEIIVKSYRKSLAGKEGGGSASSSQNGVILIQQPAGGPGVTPAQ